MGTRSALEVSTRPTRYFQGGCQLGESLAAAEQVEGVGFRAPLSGPKGMENVSAGFPGPAALGKARSPRGQRHFRLMGKPVPERFSLAGPDARDGGGGEPDRDKSSL